jgi:hypothetical protein
MLGFLIGTACLIGLVKTLGGGCGSRYGGWGYHGGCGRGRGPQGPFDPFGPDAREHRPGFFLRGLFQTLETTPGQEKVIADAVSEVREAGRKLRGELKDSRADVAKAMRAATFDEVLFGDLFSRHDTALESIRKSVVGALARTHDALDERQRARLADLVERGPAIFRRRSWGFGPFEPECM